MRSLKLLLGVVCAAVLFAVPASAERGSWNNWHVHDGQAGLNPDSSGLHHAPLAFFGLIWPDYATNQSRWAYCPDATDKSLVGGSGGAMLVSGICQNEEYVIHLKGVHASRDWEPHGGWTYVTNAGPGGQYKVYYKLTSR